MNAAGPLLVIAGIWVLTQTFGGNALGRLGIAGKPDVAKNPSATGKSGLAPGTTSGSGTGGGGGGSW